MNYRESVIFKIKALADEKYLAFHSRLVPGCHNLLGVRVPLLRKLADEVIRTGGAGDFLTECRYEFYEETMLAGMIIGRRKATFAEKTVLLEDFLPHVKNWGVCDVCAGEFKSSKKDGDAAFLYFSALTVSEKPFTVRFGIVALLGHFFNAEYLDRITETLRTVKCGDYYVDMALAWTLSVGLVKFYGQIVPLIENKIFPPFVHNKAIQKAAESFRMTDDLKTYLKKLRY
jgi:3-methyladenine DNA glycosylase AlkD